MLFGVLLGLIFLNLPSLLAINNIRSFSMRKQRNCRVLRPLLGCTVGTKQRSFSYLKEICQFWRRFLCLRWFFLETTYPQLLNKIITSRCCFKIVGNHLSFQEEIAAKKYFKFWLRVHNWRNGLKTFFSWHSSVGHPAAFPPYHFTQLVHLMCFHSRSFFQSLGISSQNFTQKLLGNFST